MRNQESVVLRTLSSDVLSVISQLRRFNAWCRPDGLCSIGWQKSLNWSSKVLFRCCMPTRLKDASVARSDNFVVCWVALGVSRRKSIVQNGPHLTSTFVVARCYGTFVMCEGFFYIHEWSVQGRDFMHAKQLGHRDLATFGNSQPSIVATLRSALAGVSRGGENLLRYFCNSHKQSVS